MDKVKNYLKILILFLILYIGDNKINSMNLLNNDLTKEILIGTVETINTIANDIESSFSNKAKELEIKMRFEQDPEMKKIYAKELENLINSKNKSTENFTNLTHNALDLAKDYVRDAILGEKEREQQINLAAIKAESEKEAQLEKAKEYIKAFTNKDNAKLLVFTAAGIFAAWHGTKIAAKIINNYLEKIPTIAEETSLLSYKEKAINYLSGKNSLVNESNIDDVILEKDLKKRIDILADSVKNTVKNNGYFRHMLFYGPPGTGKTMLAKRIARSSGLEYIYFAGSSIEQLSTEKALTQIVELFEFSKISSKKLMIIIDEAEVLLANRANSNLSDKTRKILNLILAYTGTESSNFIIVALTNRPEDLDSAFLSRCDEKIEIGVPNFNERAKILKSYIEKYLISSTKQQKEPSFFEKIFLGKAVPPKALIIENNLFNNDFIVEIARKLDNFVGRDISKLVIAIRSDAYASKDLKISKELVNKVVNQKIEEKIKVTNNFK